MKSKIVINQKTFFFAKTEKFLMAPSVPVNSDGWKKLKGFS